MLTGNRYVESLKRRVAELEQKVKAAEMSHVQIRRSFNSDAALPINGKRRRSTEGYAPVVSAEPNNTLPNCDDQSTVEDTVSAIGLLSNRAMAESRAHTGNEPHKLSMIESISAALAVDGQDPSKASASSSHNIPLDNHQPIVLTPDLTSIYIQRFIDWSVWLPHIDESHLMQQYHAVVDSDGTDQPSLHRFNTYLAVAIGISMSSEKGRLTALATNLHSAATKLLPSILHSQEPFDTLHCMLLLAVFSLFNPSGGSTWHLMGFIWTNCLAAGLHKTAIPQSRLGPDTAYRSDWIFWTVYLLDRSLASSMGRPFGITDEDISVTVNAQDPVQ